MVFEIVDNFINVMSKYDYYIIDKKGYSYQIRPLIYDANFKVGEETS